MCPALASFCSYIFHLNAPFYSSLDTATLWFLHTYSVILFFLPLGISTSLLFNIFIAVSFKLSHCFLLVFKFPHLSTPCLGHCMCGTALLQCLVNSEILLWHVKGLFSSRAEREALQLTILRHIHWSHRNRAQFGSYWYFTRYWSLAVPCQIRQQRSDTCRLIFCFLMCVQFEEGCVKDLWGAGLSRQR